MMRPYGTRSRSTGADMSQEHDVDCRMESSLCPRQINEGDQEGDNSSYDGSVIIRNEDSKRGLSEGARRLAISDRAIGAIIEAFIKPVDCLEKIGSPANLSFKQVNYSLNKSKAAIKKLAASNHTLPYNIVCTGQAKSPSIIIHCQAGLYELIRRALHAYFVFTKNHRYEVIITILQEKSSSLTVQSNYQIKRRGGGNAIYSLSLYHTKSAVMANGKGAQLFMKEDWQNIIDIVNLYERKKDHTHTEVNENIKQQLQRLTQDLSQDLPQPPSTATESNKGPQLLEQGAMANPEVEHILPIKDKMVGTPQLQKYHREDRDMAATPHSRRDSQSESVGAATEMLQKTQMMEESQDSLPALRHRSQISTGQTESLPTPTLTPRAVGGLQLQPALASGWDLWKTPPLDINISGDRAKEPQTNTTTTLRTPGHRERITAQQGDTHLSPLLAGDPRPTTQYFNKQVRLRDTHNRDFATEMGRRNEGQAPQTCSNCRYTRAEWNTALLDIQQREKKVNQTEKSLKAREKELEKTLGQVETQKAVIAGLEARVKELTGSNRILQQLVDAADQRPHAHTQDTRPVYPPGRIPDHPHERHKEQELQEAKEDIRYLREELRMRDMEARLTSRMQEMENRLRFPNMFHPFPQPHPIPFPWYTHQTPFRERQPMHNNWTHRTNQNTNTHHQEQHPHQQKRNPCHGASKASDTADKRESRHTRAQEEPMNIEKTPSHSSRNTWRGRQEGIQDRIHTGTRQRSDEVKRDTTVETAGSGYCYKSASARDRANDLKTLHIHSDENRSWQEREEEVSRHQNFPPPHLSCEDSHRNRKGNDTGQATGGKKWEN